VGGEGGGGGKGGEMTQTLYAHMNKRFHFKGKKVYALLIVSYLILENFLTS
jgi:hypothetical protein